MGLFNWFKKKPGGPSGARIRSLLDELFRAVAKLSAQGRWEEALPLAQRATDLARTHPGEFDPVYTASLHNLAFVHQAMGDYATALPLLERAAEINRAIRGDAHPVHADSLHKLALLHRVMGDYGAAEPLLLRAMEVYRVALGDGHPDYGQSLDHLGYLYAAWGRDDEAFRLMLEAATIADRMIGQIFGMGTERQRASYLASHPREHFRCLSLVLDRLPHSREAVHAAFDLVLRHKALRAEAQAVKRDAVLGGRYPHLAPGFQELKALRIRIARKTLAGPGTDRAQEHHRQLAAWSARQDELERELARQIPEMNLEQALRAADRRAVALALSEGVTLVEFVPFPVENFKAVFARGELPWKPDRYVAFVLPAGAPDEIRMLDLGEAEPIDRMIADFRAGITGDSVRAVRNMVKQPPAPVSEASDPAGQSLRAALFDALVPALGGHTRLLLAPDGDLTRLPFEVLPTDDGRRLIDDYEISYLSCCRDVLRFGATTTTLSMARSRPTATRPASSTWPPTASFSTTRSKSPATSRSAATRSERRAG